MEGYYWEINMEADKIKFIPNSTCTKWFGVAECLRDKTMLSMSRTGAINLTPQQIDLFDKPEHCLAFRFVLVFPPGENCHPRLAVRVIRRTQTEAQSLINKLDVASMNVGSFSLNTIRANGIDQADGVPFSLYYTLFNKACTMNTYRGLLQGTLRIFLLMVYTHMNHSIASYEEAVRKKETGNIQRFKDLVRPNHREPLESRINDQGIVTISKFGARFPLSKLVKGLPPHLLEAVSLGKCSTTWGGYYTGTKHYRDYCNRVGEDIEIPLSTMHILGYISYLFRVKALSPGTVTNYISGLKAWQTLCGHPSTNFDHPLVKLVLTGYRNLFLTMKVEPRRRSVVTWCVLKILREELMKLSMSTLDRQVFWTAAVCAFWGSLRMGELLKGKHGFDAVRHMSWAKVTINPDDHSHVLLYVDLPKIMLEEKPSDHVDLFAFPLPEYCPVHNLCYLQFLTKRRRETDDEENVFLLSNAKPLSTANMNEMLRDTLNPLFPGLGKFSCHSFRAGLPSLMGAFPQLFTEQQIKQHGRWVSKACTLYTRMNGVGIRQTHAEVVKTLLNTRSSFA
jgi:hypothetical protein